MDQIYKEYKIWDINEKVLVIKDIDDEDFLDLFKRIEQKIKKQNQIIINIYIFAYNKNEQFSNIKKTYPANIIYGKELNKVQLQVFTTNIDNIRKYEYLYHNGYCVWLYLSTGMKHFLYYDGLTFGDNGFAEQCMSNYEFVFNRLYEFGFESKHIVKFWNFIDNILDRYKSFNEVRDIYFKNNWILWDYPAGTGIDCKSNGNYLMNSALFTVKSEDGSVNISSMKSVLQCDAVDYGPKFSRAKIVDFKYDNMRKIYISGTASVDNEWNSIYTDDINKNIWYTMECVGHLLEKAGMKFDNIVSAFVYLKKFDYYKNFLDYYEQSRLWFPFIYTFCDICRDDFLFEIECIAVWKIS